MRDQIQSPDVHGIFDKATGTVTYTLSIKAKGVIAP